MHWRGLQQYNAKQMVHSYVGRPVQPASLGLESSEHGPLHHGIKYWHALLFKFFVYVVVAAQPPIRGHDVPVPVVRYMELRLPCSLATEKQCSSGAYAIS